MQSRDSWDTAAVVSTGLGSESIETNQRRYESNLFEDSIPVVLNLVGRY